MSSARSRMSAPPISSRRTLLSRDRQSTRSRRTSRAVEEDADGEDADQFESEDHPPRRRPRTDRLSQSVTKAGRRTRSFTHTMLMTHENINDSPAVKKARLRKSLAGPVVHEMTIETRALIVSEMAEDCIIKLLRSTVQNRDELGWRYTFQALQSESSCGMGFEHDADMRSSTPQLTLRET